MPKKITDIFGLVVLGLILFVAGFYFGYKTMSSSAGIGNPFGPNNSSGAITAANSSSTQEVKIEAKDVPGVYWIKAGESPVCPPEYPIKGRFDNSANVFYTKDSKMYNRVSPDICFATEDFAQNSAGFVRKF